MNKNRYLKLWGMPLVMAFLSMFGLIAALTGTGIWHWLSWMALATPIITIGWFLFKATPRQQAGEQL